MKRSIACLVVLAACGMAAVCPRGAAGAESARQLSADQVKALVAKLGDADFKVREAAQKDLAAAGPSVLPALEQAAKSDDAEVKQRALEAIKQIKNGIALAVSQEMAKNYLWSYPIGNGVVGSPVVRGGVAYAVGQDWALHAVDAKTGKKVWDFALPVKGTPQMSVGEKVISLVVGTTLTVVNAQDGSQLWKKDLRPAPAAAPAGGAGADAAPAPLGQAGNAPLALKVAGGRVSIGRPQAWVAGDVVVARVGLDKLKAFQALTGEDAWEMEVKPGAVNCIPVVAGGVLYLSEGESVSAVDLATRKRIWTQELANCASLTLGAQTLACAAGGKIVALETKKGDKLWEADLPAGGAGLNVAASSLRAGSLVMDDSRLYAIAGEEMVTFDLQKGQRATARLDLSIPQPAKEVGANPAAGQGDGVVVVGPAGAMGGGMIMTTNSMYRGGLVRWTAADGTLYVGYGGGLFAFDGKSGQRLWVLPMKQMMSADPAVAGGVIYFGTTRYGAAATDDTPPKDLPGLHAVKLKAGAPASAAPTPAKADAPPAARPAKRIDGPLPPVRVAD